MNKHMIKITGVTKSFGTKCILNGIDLVIPMGSFVALVGPSGCGKSTLLNCIVGTSKPTDGKIEIWSASKDKYVPITGPGRDRGMVYQRYSLFPNLTALDNVALGPIMDETSILFRLCHPFEYRRMKRQYLEDAEAMLRKVGLGNAMHCYPDELSGGMCQRVAIAQALIMKPKVLLMDEAFGALDEATREDLQRVMLTLYAENEEAKKKGEDPPYTVIFVTHEIGEAIFMSDRMVAVSQYYDGNTSKNDFGARVVYDKDQPVFDPEEPKDLLEHKHIEKEVIHAAFDKKVFQNPNDAIDHKAREERRKQND